MGSSSTRYIDGRTFWQLWKLICWSRVYRWQRSWESRTDWRTITPSPCISIHLCLCDGQNISRVSDHVADWLVVAKYTTGCETDQICDHTWVSVVQKTLWTPQALNFLLHPDLCHVVQLGPRTKRKTEFNREGFKSADLSQLTVYLRFLITLWMIKV